MWNNYQVCQTYESRMRNMGESLEIGIMSKTQNKEKTEEKEKKILTTKPVK